MESIEGKLDDIRNGLLRRPSWAVALVLTCLSTLVVGLVIALVKLR